MTPSFDPHPSPLPRIQVVINISNSNYCHASPYFAKTVSDVNPINIFPPQVLHSSGENINSQSESDLLQIILKKIKEELGSK